MSTNRIHERVSSIKSYSSLRLRHFVLQRDSNSVPSEIQAPSGEQFTAHQALNSFVCITGVKEGTE